MICHEYRDSISLLIDGELSPDAADEIRTHLSGCPACTEHADALSALVEAIRPGEASAPTPGESRFWRRFEADLALRVAGRRGSDTPFWLRSIPLPLPLAASGLVVMTVISVVAIRTHVRAERLSERGAQLESALNSMREDSIFGSAFGDATFTASSSPAARNASARPERARVPPDRVSGIQAASFSGSVSRSLPVAPVESAAPQPRVQIRYIDSDGVIQPGLY